MKRTRYLVASRLVVDGLLHLARLGLEGFPGGFVAMAVGFGGANLVTAACSSWTSPSSWAASASSGRDVEPQPPPWRAGGPWSRDRNRTREMG